VQFEDDGGKTSTCLVEEVEASFKGFAFFRFVALVYCVVPYLPRELLVMLRFAQISGGEQRSRDASYLTIE